MVCWIIAGYDEKGPSSWICLKILPKVWKVLLKTVILDHGFGSIEISGCHYLEKKLIENQRQF